MAIPHVYETQHLPTEIEYPSPMLEPILSTPG